jgi:hypothetical protein
MEKSRNNFTKGRIREIALINLVSEIIKKKLTIEDTLQQIAFSLPQAFKFKDACARIIYREKEYVSQPFKVSPWRLVREFQSYEGSRGLIEVYYDLEHVKKQEGPFSLSEVETIDKVIDLITRFINEKTAINIRKNRNSLAGDANETVDITSSNYLHRFLNHTYSNRDVYHDLMPFKVKEILLISTLYDAFSIENEGRIFDQVLGEYQQLNLSSMPRITGVTKINDAFKALKEKHYDLVVIMTGMNHKKSIFISREIKKMYSYIPVFLLLNNNSEIGPIELQHKDKYIYDRIFVWNGDSNIFFAMIKNVEDRVNLDNDTSKALVRVILLVEDSPKFYSRFLPVLYKVVMDQTRRIIRDVQADELYKVLRIRARPKIILATNYEQAVDILENYKGFILTVITDMSYDIDGKKSPTAGLQLANRIRIQNSDIPIVIQSSEPENEKIAREHGIQFIDKNADNLSVLFRNFITEYLGFGDFIFRLPDRTQVGEAKTMNEFVKMLEIIPDESLEFHAIHNHFSLWLMARGEVEIAKIIRPANVKDFETIEEIRRYIIDTIEDFRQERVRGKVIPYEEHHWNDNTNIVMLADGALGGKGRGIAFIYLLVYNIGFRKLVDGLNITTPRTFIIGTDEYDNFISQNRLYERAVEINDFEKIKLLFLRNNISEDLEHRLLELVKNIDKPLAVRSSSLFEDSLSQSFSGVFETYMLPNNHPDLRIRWKQLITAVKMVYASVFSNLAKGYIESVNYKLDEEKMAIVIQEVVGQQSGDYYYPHISGVAQSYNFYPFSHMKPEDGYALMALGLGTYVVEGEKCFRFSPKYPKLQLKSVKDQFKDSQVSFCAINLKNSDPHIENGENSSLIKLDLYDAEMHGTLKHIASTYNPENDTIQPGIRVNGPRILNFANILQHNYIPLADTISKSLKLVQEAMDTPVEIEFAVDLTKDENGNASFHLLQVKPLLGKSLDFEIHPSELEGDNVVLISEKGMGNGVIEYINNIIFVDPNLFDKTKTKEMVKEISEFNKICRDNKNKYVLIGPGRWGTRDEWIGIPVKWPDISNAKIIVETDLEGYPLEASAGSHFFNNVISMNVGYYSVHQKQGRNFINYDFLRKQKIIRKGKWFLHVRTEKNLTIKMDGKKGICLILS